MNTRLPAVASAPEVRVFELQPELVSPVTGSSRLEAAVEPLRLLEAAAGESARAADLAALVDEVLLHSVCRCCSPRSTGCRETEVGIVGRGSQFLPPK
jgi:hypothetical protein